MNSLHWRSVLIPENAWVERDRRSGRAHQVFSSNYRVLTMCGRWLSRYTIDRGALVVLPSDPPAFHRCSQCVKAAVR